MSSSSQKSSNLFLPILIVVSAFLLQVSYTNTTSEADIQSRQTLSVPDFIKINAPVVYLDKRELYFPSDIQAQLNNTYPAIDFTPIPSDPSFLLSDLDQLNLLGNCTLKNLHPCPIYLTSKANVTANPQWLYGTKPDPVIYDTVGARSNVVIVNDHGAGVVDAFYMYFYAFNLGNTVSGQTLGNHVGDWEHTMIRFRDGTPTAMWFSQHDSGQAFTYETVSKNGTRPIVYSAMGTHANFAVPGIHTRSIGSVLINDTASAGYLWDPILSAYYYTYFPSSGSFASSDTSTPVSWLSFLGRWGDKQYPDSDPRQLNFLNLSISWRYESGPTGPLDKDLDRKEVCPGDGNACTTLSALPALVTGSEVASTVSTSNTGDTIVSVTATATGSVPKSSPTSSNAADANGTDSTLLSVCLCMITMVIVTVF